MLIRQSLLKARAAIRFRRITFSVIRIMFWERLNRYWAEKGKKGSVPLTKPQGIVMRVTERCFLRCRMCGQNSEQGGLRGTSVRNRLRIEPIVFERMVKEIRSWRNKPFVKLTGGEPLIEWKVLKPYVKELHEMGCVIKLNSNAVLLKDRRLARDIIETGVDYLSVSIDGTEKIHNEIRGLSTAYRNSRHGVRNVLEERENHGSVYPMVLLSSVVSTINENDIVKISEVAKNWGVDWLNIQFLNFVTPQRSEKAKRVVFEAFGISDAPWVGFEIPELTRVDVDKLSRSIDSIRRTASCPVSVMKAGDMPEELWKFHYSDEAVSKHICHMPFVTMFVVPEGFAVYCIDYPYYRYGDLREQSLEQTWFGARARSFRGRLMDYHRENECNFPQCLRCNWPFNT